MLLSPFNLLGLEPVFFLPIHVLDEAFKQAQKRIHPDRFPKAFILKRGAMQMTQRLNQAYQALRAPLHRAQILLEHADAWPVPEDNAILRIIWDKKVAWEGMSIECDDRLAWLRAVYQTFDRAWEDGDIALAQRSFLFLQGWAREIDWHDESLLMTPEVRSDLILPRAA